MLTTKHDLTRQLQYANIGVVNGLKTMCRPCMLNFDKEINKFITPVTSRYVIVFGQSAYLHLTCILILCQ